MNEKIDDLSDHVRKLKARNTELEEDAAKMVEQMKLRLEQAEVDIEKRSAGIVESVALAAGRSRAFSIFSEGLQGISTGVGDVPGSIDDLRRPLPA